MYTIIKDSREQIGWDFEPDYFCKEMVIDKLETGDYSIKGYEKLLTIERKRNTAEICGNLFSSDGRFTRELERMSTFKYAFLVFEFTLGDVMIYPQMSGLPFAMQKRTKITGAALLKKLIETQISFPYVQFVYAGKKGKEFTLSLMKRVIEHENPK